MKYCARCVLPDTKPHLRFDTEGICSACRHYEQRASIDYAKRMEELKAILEKYKNPNGYDCIVPSSGGKDSTFQALQMRELGMHPLIVTATTDKLTDLGRRNIENLKHQGFDTIEVTPNPLLRRKINKLALETVGDISWPEHVLIFTIPVRLAVQMGIPLIVWGENSQNEYGGPATAAESSVLTRRWLEEYGGLNGLRVSDLPDMLGASEKDLLQYTYPTDAELKRVGVTGIFLGYFIPWNGKHNADVAQDHGFWTYEKWVEGSIGNYENLDNAHTGLHDFFKFLKFGFGRASDIASSLIRRGEMSRDTALQIVKERDGAYPNSYLGVTLAEILSDIGMTREQFNGVVGRFKNKKIHADLESHTDPALSGR